MRHRVKGRGLGRTSSHRRAMLRNMVTSLLENERIETTLEKAKEARSIAEKIITLGKRQDLHARRLALRIVRRKDVVAKVFSDLAERFKDRPGGYTRITRLGHRAGDGANMSILELLPATSEKAPGAKKTRRLRKPKGAKEGEATKSKAALREKAEKKTKPATKKKEERPSAKKEADKKAKKEKAVKEEDKKKGTSKSKKSPEKSKKDKS